MTAALLAFGCTTASETPDVTYVPGTPIGEWDYSSGTGVPEAGSGGAGASSSVALAGSASRDATVAPAGAGGAAGSIAGSGGTGGSAGRGSAGSAAGSGGAAGAPAANAPAANSVTSLAFDVTTSPVGYRYQPKNIGAIWVQDKNGKLVKSLEVWARTRRRWLTRYQSQLAGSAVDVTASATLPNHKTHHVTWDLKDKSGAAVAPGSYTLAMELTDGDQAGRMNTIPFDTSAGPQTQTPANAPSFNSMKLQLQ